MKISEMIDFSYYNKIGFVLLLPLVFVFLMSRIDLRKTKRLFFVFFSNSYFYAYPVDTTPNISLFTILRFGFASTLLGLLIMLLFYDKDYLFAFFFTAYFESLGMSVLYLLIKYFVAEFVYFASNKKSYYKQMLVLETSYLTSVLMANYFVISYAFLHLKELDVVFKIMYISLLITYFMRLSGMLINNKNLLSGKLFYIILYLCTLEIFPFIYLFKRYLV
ncbi:DUF4271 domain-containing protein [Wenyingzhuangia sp. 2_MG-2023]|uniref:DUF4271 domain-containing protein n=1 Tax=Wenyingzhuangia sp. 2_MG-2023 TaxID=3062639 RepID=UPI0026E1F251|nr:DUF4271 domain-containing protein [Wenyingzhuangia sp. 2_MG-2023]MDO6736983.1 DUF4271 domain-containing protein [Wenyingzhuangia sp. 2_MG-2023]MDO6801847.1 DUF4271 domain-containing protein [Wenyingzhuangia sp. 1_MG-2023]